MSKIAEKKALEAYPIKIRHSLDANRQYREGYTTGYDQATQDLMEKACEWLMIPKSVYIFSQEDKELFVEDFKNYMKNEEM